MTRLLLLLVLPGLFAAAPLVAQSRSASIGASATIAEPMRMPEAPSVRVDYRDGRYLDVTASGASGAVPFLTQVVVAADRGAEGGAAAGGSVRGRGETGGRALPAREGEARYRLDLGGRAPARDGEVRVTYVIAANL